MDPRNLCCYHSRHSTIEFGDMGQCWLAPPEVHCHLHSFKHVKLQIAPGERGVGGCSTGPCRLQVNCRGSSRGPVMAFRWANCSFLKELQVVV